MLSIWTYDWVPDAPRGFVRDLRLRWACEEAGLPYRVRSTPFDDRGPEHFARQPFGQVPFLDDDGLKIFESGAGLLHLARKSERLMPRDPAGAAETLQWTIAALNSVEMVSQPWAFLSWSVGPDNALADWLGSRLRHVDAVLRDREWIAAGRFTVADIIMADVLRQPLHNGVSGYPSISAYVARACERPGFKKAHADQLAHFAAGDRARSG